MPIPFVCPHCGLETTVADRYAGQSGPCAQCGKTITIPPLRGLAGPVAQKPGLGPALAVLGLVLVGGLVVLGFFGFFLLASPRTGPDARQIQCASNLRRIGSALHNYHDVYGCFPPAVVNDKQGKPMHSWRVALLPFLNEHALYAQYDANQSWDGPKNRNIAPRAPSVYRCPAAPVGSGAETNYVMIVGAGTVGGQPNRSVSLADIHDGTSNTVMVVEVVGSGIGWSQPRDLSLDGLSLRLNDGAGKGPSSSHPAGVNVLFCDGQVQALMPSIDPEALRLLFNHSDGVFSDFSSFVQPVE